MLNISKSKPQYSQFTIVIPCYNEEQTIALVLTKMLKLGVGRIIVVDDGSSDHSAEIINSYAQYYPVTYLKNSENLGQGASTNRGIHYSKQFNDSKYVITVDADDQHLPEDVKKIMDKFLEDDYLIVHGARQFSSDIPRSKKMTNFISRQVFRVLYGISMPDPTGGLRGYSNVLIDEIEFESGHEYIVGANRLIKRYKEHTAFVPITARYTDYSLQKGLNMQKGIKLFILMFTTRLKEILGVRALKSIANHNNYKADKINHKFSLNKVK
jgi:glycosyltransferase involved in cell wall biosynthesis